MKRARKAKVADPFVRECTGCGAFAGEPCRTVGKHGKPLPVIPYATRLVHAARLEGATNA